jgi:hypothetical protein
MTFKTRKLKQYSFRKLDLVRLRDLGNKVKCSDRFHQDHGNLLGIVRMKVDEGLLGTFVQFYDPEYHCFGFPEFQLVPTLEEYAFWIDRPVLNQVPFSGLENPPKFSTIAEALHLPTTEVKDHITTNSKLLGLPTKFLYEKADYFYRMSSADAFDAILALLIYGLVLFPNLNNFVDIHAISIFLSKNPAPTLLADTYHSIHERTLAGRGLIKCCAPLLYRWITSHLPRTPRFTTNPDGLRWSERLMALTPNEVVWYEPAYDKGTIIDSCGLFNNVPLMGMYGGISYNPVLARRQFRLPMEGKPLSIHLENVYYHNESDTAGMRRQIARAWHAVRRRDRGQLGKRTGAVHADYTQWVIDRSTDFGMPYKLTRFLSATTPATPMPMTLETEREYQKKIAELMEENARVTEEYKEVVRENECVMGLLEQKDWDISELKKEIVRLNEEKEAIIGQIPGHKKKRSAFFANTCSYPSP